MTRSQKTSQLTDVISRIPYRLALAGGWIDQPFVSRHDPDPPGSMVVVALEPVTRFMDRAGFATGTRRVAQQLWRNGLPDRDPAELARELYAEENQGQTDPSGSQDMIGLIYPGISRLDYDATHADGIFPVSIENNRDAAVAHWLEDVLHIIPVAQRPEGYHPLGEKNLDPAWIRRLGQSGADCYSAILARDLTALGASMNECMACWEAVLPRTVRHSTIKIDLLELMRHYQSRYSGAMFSGCGGGYLFVASQEPVPGAFKPKVRI
jgi:hypothetical protein